MTKHVVLLDGPIGAGKTTYGRYLASEFVGKFLDGDDYSAPGLPWYASSLTTSRRILDATLHSLETVPIVFVAYPIRCINYVFFHRQFSAVDVETVVIGLQARLRSISAENRGRSFTNAELSRSEEMITQGYGSRAFSDFFVHTDEGSETDVIEKAKAALQQRLSTSL